MIYAYSDYRESVPDVRTAAEMAVETIKSCCELTRPWPATRSQPSRGGLPGHFIAHVERETFPTISGTSLESAAHPLEEKEVSEPAGVKMEPWNSLASA